MYRLSDHSILTSSLPLRTSRFVGAPVPNLHSRNRLVRNRKCARSTSIANSVFLEKNSSNSSRQRWLHICNLSQSYPWRRWIKKSSPIIWSSYTTVHDTKIHCFHPKLFLGSVYPSTKLWAGRI